MRFLLWLRNAVAVLLGLCVFTGCMSLVAKRPDYFAQNLQLFVILLVVQGVILLLISRLAKKGRP